ncbi:MAG TPA: UDP-N-acetylmuramate:L-alanyl-gamma-D-glutamyl-meso-diaminopimelate ligase [Acidobacteriaceae bacterium]|nr:UDP-N-acetylmuramate:L-alanyl-gamma-D-glutamyl-meso-diaminopimelate ligase [Acidobacteriaceae bacterium]
MMNEIQQQTGSGPDADVRHVHLIGICGSAMASLAGMLQLRGWRVTGSDKAAYPPMSDLLEQLHIPIAQPFAEDNLKPHPDLVIVGNAISRGNLELEYVLDQRLPFRSLAQLIHEEFLIDRESLVIAGTHGKTTTTSMLAWIYETAAADDPAFAPSFLIGGIAENFGSSFALRPTRPFVLEGDEYDTAFFDKGPKFLHYFPDALILTHVEFDHADIYADLESVKTAFKRLVNLVPRRGRIVAFDGSENVTECVARAFCAVERYGFAQDSHWRIADLSIHGNLSRWRIERNGQPWLEVEMPTIGEHNVLNATAAAALAAGQGVPSERIRTALQSFRSVKRRLEIIAEVSGVTVIDDFAHHPTAIRETLRALRLRYPGSRLWAVIEPRSNTLRRNVFEQELTDSLALADEVVLAAVFQATNIPADQILHPEHIVQALESRGCPAHQFPDVAAIVAHLAANVKSGDVVAILSNGGFDGIYAKLPERLRSGHGSTVAS